MNYEIVCIFSPKIIEKELKEHTQKIIKLLEDNDASDIQDNLWGKKSLAYDIKGFSDGYYVQFNFAIDSEKIKELDKKLKLNEEVIRFLITKQEEIGEVKVLQNDVEHKEEDGKKRDEVKEKKEEVESGEGEPTEEDKKTEKEPKSSTDSVGGEEKKDPTEPVEKEKTKEEKKEEDDLDKKIDEVLEKDIVD